MQNLGCIFNPYQDWSGGKWSRRAVWFSTGAAAVVWGFKEGFDFSAFLPHITDSNVTTR